MINRWHSMKAKHLEVRPTQNPNLIEACPSGQNKRMPTYMRLEVPGSSNPNSDASSDASTKMSQAARRGKNAFSVVFFVPSILINFDTFVTACIVLFFM